MTFEEIIYEKDGMLATITLNRPQKLNAYTYKMGQEIVEALKDSSNDDEIRCVIFTGSGRGFSAGVDVSGTQPRATPSRRTKVRRDSNFGPPVRALWDFEKPTFVAVNGIAAGGGLSLAMACDIRIASDRAQFSEIFVKRGIIPDNGATYFLPRIVGVARALELMWTGEIIKAQEAERIGLVSKVVPHEELMTATKEVAMRIAKGPSVSTSLTKRAVYHALTHSDLHHQIELELHYNSICQDTEDSKEAAKAFVEKREPVFKGK